MKNIAQIIVTTLYLAIILIVVFFINELKNQNSYTASNFYPVLGIISIIILYVYIIREFLKGDFSKLETEVKRIKEENLILKKRISTLSLEKELRKIRGK
ncbi:hypothetical protein [Fontibacter flavus]|uniref:Uncharacterized protein n=1 Tax=Fontibacter flavus TaxID=654838 RepID=A0ABV6FV38_9BACT